MNPPELRLNIAPTTPPPPNLPKPPNGEGAAPKPTPESPIKPKELSIQTAKDKVEEATNQAMTEMANISEKEVNAHLENNEKAYLENAKSGVMANAEKTQDPKEIEKAKAKCEQLQKIYESASAENILGQMNEIAKGANIPEITPDSTVALPEKFSNTSIGESPELRNHLLAELKTEINALVKDIDSRDKLYLGVDALYGSIAKGWENFSGTKNTQDVHRIVRFKMLNLVLQERRSAKVSAGDHGIEHVQDHDIRIARKIGEDMGLPPESVTRIDLAGTLHDNGYTHPEVSTSLEAGKFGPDWGHAVVGAKIYREFWNMGMFKGLYKDAISQANMHGTIQYHDKVGYINIKDPGDLAALERSCLIAADVSAVFHDKIPIAMRRDPDALLTALFKIKVAKENFVTTGEDGQRVLDKERYGKALDAIKKEAADKVEASTKLDADQKAETLTTIYQLNDLTPDFMAGRLSRRMDPINECGYDKKTNQIYFNFAPGVEVMDLLGRKAVFQERKLLTEFGLPENQVDTAQKNGFADVAAGQIHIALHNEAVPLSSTQEFQNAAHEVSTRLRLENMEYIEYNKLLKSLIQNPKDPEFILNKLNAPEASAVYDTAMVRGFGHFYKDGKLPTQEEFRTMMQNQQSRNEFTNALYISRAAKADSIVYNTQT